MPLSHDEQTLFSDTLRILKLKAATSHQQQDLSSKSAPGISSAQESSTPEVPKEQRSSGGRKWPALMLLGSGTLEAYPSAD